MGVDQSFVQGYPCFRPWLPLGVVYFSGFGYVSGSGEIWYMVGAWLIRIGGGDCVFYYFYEG